MEYNAPSNLAEVLVKQRSDDALSSTPQGINQGYLQGTESADKMMNREDSFNSNIGNPMSDAIRSKFSQGYNQDRQSLQRSTGLEARNSYFQKLQSAADLVAKEQALNHQKQMAAYQAKQDKKRARGALVGQVLGIGGMVAGGMAGGPGGAMAGGAIGQGVGQQVGGQ